MADLFRRNFSEADYRANEWVWLLEVGHHRIASQTVAVEVAGTEYLYRAGLVAVGWDRSLDYQTLTFEEVASVEVLLPDNSLLRDGLARREASLSLLKAGDAYESRLLVAEGYVTDPQYGSPDEPVRFGIEADYVADGDNTTFPGVFAMQDKYSSGLPNATLGKNAPFVYGLPGTQTLTADQGSYLTPAPVVSVAFVANGPNFDRTTTLQVSVNRLPETYESILQLGWFRVGDPAIGDAIIQFGGDFITTNDETGATLEIVDTTLLDTQPEPAEYWIAWKIQAPVLPVDVDNGQPTLSNLVRYLFGLMQVDIDWAAMGSAFENLSRYSVGFYINDPAVTIRDWLTEVGEVFGFAWAEGPRGAFLMTRPDRDVFKHPRAALSNRDNASRIGDYAEPVDDVIGGYELAFGQSMDVTGSGVPFVPSSALGGGYYEVLNESQERFSTEGQADYWGQASDSLSPTEEIGDANVIKESAYYIVDEDTANQVVSEQVFWRGFVPRSVQIELIDPSLADLDVGDVVTWADDDIGLAATDAYVSAISVNLEEVVLTLTMLPE